MYGNPLAVGLKIVADTSQAFNNSSIPRLLKSGGFFQTHKRQYVYLHLSSKDQEHFSPEREMYRICKK